MAGTSIIKYYNHGKLNLKNLFKYFEACMTVFYHVHVAIIETNSMN